ncbi:MAG TPA: hypothetical protein PLB10_09725 [Thiolinea sp.]|nr:hypothetical protein [Thiolinea sp.]
MPSQSLFSGVASLLLLAMATLHIFATLVPLIPLWLSGLCGWIALLLLLLSRPGQFSQFFWLGGAGVLFLLLGSWRGSPIVPEKLLLQNNGLMVMLYCVGFLKLVAASAGAIDRPLPTGRLAFIKTLLGVHVLGAVINVSILILVSERLKARDALGRQAVTLIGRSFSMAAFWSPFFAAMAVALNYAPGARPYDLISTGLLLTAIGMLVTLIGMGGRGLKRLADFQGYPMQFSSLWIPLLLAGSVAVTHYFLPQLPILLLVSTLSLLLVSVLLFATRPRTAAPLLQGHIRSSSTRMARELGLFMGAGLLSVGVEALFASFTGLQPFSSVDWVLLSGLLAGAILLSLLGVHPVVSVGVIGPFLAPLPADPSLLATLYLCIWALGVVASPYSGLNTIMRSQFNVAALDVLRWNIGYVLIMWLMVSGLFYLQT